MTDEIFRIRVGVRKGGASYHETRYYTEHEREQMLTDFLQFSLETKGDWSSRAHGTEDRVGKKAADIWLKRLRFKSEGKVRTVQAVEQHTGEGWVPIEYVFTPPAVYLMGRDDAHIGDEI